MVGAEAKAPGYEFERVKKELNYFASMNMDFWMGGEKRAGMEPGKEDGNRDLATHCRNLISALVNGAQGTLETAMSPILTLSCFSHSVLIPSFS